MKLFLLVIIVLSFAFLLDAKPCRKKRCMTNEDCLDYTCGRCFMFSCIENQCACSRGYRDEIEDVEEEFYEYNEDVLEQKGKPIGNGGRCGSCSLPEDCVGGRKCECRYGFDCVNGKCQCYNK